MDDRLSAPIVRSLATSALVAMIAGAATAQTPNPPAKVPEKARFAAPVRVHVGGDGNYLGVDRLYPSPVFQDVDGNGRLDLVIGDLRGKLTVAMRLAGDGAPAWGADVAMKARDGKDLDFSNW